MDVLVIPVRGATEAARGLLDRVLVRDPPLVALGEPDPALLAALRRGEGDVAFGRPRSGLGPADRLAAAALRRLAGVELSTPLRLPVALRGELLPLLVPFAPCTVIGLGVAVDAARAGFSLCEVAAGPLAARGPLAEARLLRDVARLELARR